MPKTTPTVDKDINVPGNGWISVKDRLPDKDGVYLCYQPFEQDACKVNTVRWLRGKGYWKGKEAGSHIEGIIYWMPLPEPPEGTK